MSAPITFVIPGVSADGSTRGARAAVPPSIGHLKVSVTVTAQRGAGDSNLRIEAVPGEDIVVVDIVGGPSLWLHPESARDLLQSQYDPLLARGGAPLAAGEVRVPARLRWRLEEAAPMPSATRGFLGDVQVQAVHVITGIVEDKAANFVASKVVQAFDSQVNPGVYQLLPDTLDSLKGHPKSLIADGDEASLVLIHGTFSQTPGTFGKLWREHPQLVDQLFKRFRNRVYALDHPTLGASPIANAITLAEAAPKGARLHLLTHSRGGLVAEVLARVCTKPGAAGIDLFKDDPSGATELKKLAELVADKRISVERVVRVACPARGTLLASKRLDAYVSVLKWALELAQIPVAPQLLDFLGEVARRRADPDKVPGLAAQIPDSPLIRWLHAAKDPIKSDLRVVAGDLQGDSVVSWVKVLLSDAFFWTDNDLVVQTRSMYGGSPREKDSTFLLDQGGKVSHFNYFSNAQTASAVVNALTKGDDTSPDGFNVIGPLSWAGQSSTGVRAALPSRPAARAAALPALFILPGILGSNLKVGNERIWLGWRLVNGFDRLAYNSKKTDVVPDGPIDIYYDDLATTLFQDHDVRPFAFDWRRPIVAEARRLATKVAAALDERKTSKQPVRIIAHSMGGLVARAMQIVDRPTWDRMMKSEGARILMLGTPNGGSWTPMQVLSGDDTFGNLLINVGAPFSGNASRQLIGNFPGFIQLQAGLLNDLGSEKNWRDLAKADLDAVRAHSQWHGLPLQLAQFEWGIPPQAVLDDAAKFRRALDKQRDTDLAAFVDKLLLVVGKAAYTPAGYAQDDTGMIYLDAPDRGDGRVTLEDAVLPGVATWVVDADHGSLPRHRAAFEGYRDLLITGKTQRLRQLVTADIARERAAAPAGPFARSRPARLSSAELPPRRELDVLTSATAAASRPTPPAASLRITIVNGDLTYISDPLLIGHYRSSRLTGAEAAMNRALNSAMSASLQRGLYPTGPGTYQVFVNVTANPDNPWQPPRPAAVIVAGLGPEGELRGSDLVNTVRQAVIGWAQRLTERSPVPAGFALATTLLGSGGSGITAGQAAQLIAQGVREANEQLAEDSIVPPRWPRIDQLTIIELYLDRASEAWNSLQALAASAPALYLVSPTIARRTGGLRRPAEAGYRGADYDFISALVLKTEDDTEEIGYTINSKRARSEVRPQPMQVRLISNLVKTASNNTNTDTQIGRTLFTLLVPTDLESFLGGSTETVLELDEGTAAIPWEILESPTSSNRHKPWSIRTKLLRKLRTATPVITVNSATADDGILVIGDPACDRKQYPVLLGARREATEVAKCVTAATSRSPDSQRSAGARVTSVISGPNASDAEPDATTVINAAFQKSWRIIHLAGHGEPPIATGKSIETRGVVLSGGSFLGAQEIEALRVKPELVFVNCCHLATDDPSRLLKATNYDRARFASGVAHALIESGVRCVIAAGWAVDDEAASVFAKEFYTALLAGTRFIDAVAAAREKAHACGGNTWAAYQCYGDPDWRFRSATGDAQSPTPSPGQEFASIASAPSLILALEQIAVESEYQRQSSDVQAGRLRYLEATFVQYRDRGDVAEAFGNAWSKSGRFEEAIAWYERARKAEDGTASLAAIEQLANVKIRLAWNGIKNLRAPSAEEIAKARKDIEDAMTLLDTLLALAPTLERESIYGSGFKRLAMVEAVADRAAEEQNAIAQMWKHYSAAEKIARGTLTHPFFYPAMNRIAAQLVLADDEKPLDDDDIASVRGSMSSAPPDFWSVLGQTELDVFVSIAAGRLSLDVERLIEDFRDHHARVSNPRMWGSVVDNATFVRSRYRRRSNESERTAADLLLGELESLAGGMAPASPEECTRRPPRPRPTSAKRVANLQRHRGSHPRQRQSSPKSGP
jgi:tetratricopeptide (TPR) repeat protein